jgi:hypothetical protein
MATIGTITVPVTLNITSRLVPGGDPDKALAALSVESVSIGNTNPSLTTLAAAMNGLSLDEFARLGAYEQAAYRDLAHNLLQVFQVTPR